LDTGPINITPCSDCEQFRKHLYVGPGLDISSSHPAKLLQSEISKFEILDTFVWCDKVSAFKSEIMSEFGMCNKLGRS